MKKIEVLQTMLEVIGANNPSYFTDNCTNYLVPQIVYFQKLIEVESDPIKKEEYINKLDVLLECDIRREFFNIIRAGNNESR